MQALAEFAPLLAFIVTYYLRGLYAATAVLMLAMLVLVAVDWLRLRRVPPLHALSVVLVLLFGSATLLLHNRVFIQWKPTVFFWLASLAFLGSFSFCGGLKRGNFLLEIRQLGFGLLNLPFRFFFRGGRFGDG